VREVLARHDVKWGRAEASTYLSPHGEEQRTALRLEP